VRASQQLLEAAARSGVPPARGLTVSAITTTDATARRLREAYGADVESMEGFAVLRAAERAGIPAIEVRGISNIVGDRARGRWDIRAGSRATVEALCAVLAVLGGTFGERTRV
jgi:futalosine hydrolase